MKRTTRKDPMEQNPEAAGVAVFGLSSQVAEPAKPEPVDDSDIGTETPSRVLLFNDEVHTFEEVIHQIMKATACAKSKAEALTWEVHSKGKAMVYEGEMKECIRVSGVLEEIALHTQIEV